VLRGQGNAPAVKSPAQEAAEEVRWPGRSRVALLPPLEGGFGCVGSGGAGRGAVQLRVIQTLPVWRWGRGVRWPRRGLLCLGSSRGHRQSREETQIKDWADAVSCCTPGCRRGAGIAPPPPGEGSLGTRPPVSQDLELSRGCSSRSACHGQPPCVPAVTHRL